MPWQCGYRDGMSPLGRMVFPRALPSGKSSSLWDTLHQDTHTAMAYLYSIVQYVYVCMYVSLSMYIRLLNTIVRSQKHKNDSEYKEIMNTPFRKWKLND